VWETFAFTIPTTNADLISSAGYADLTLHLTPSVANQSNRNESAQYSWVELEVPGSAGVEPTVDSPTFANVTDNSAILGGRVTNLGTPASLSGGCGVVWGLAPGNWPNSVPGAVPCSAVNDVFTVQVNGLPSDDQIYFRAWANNGLDGFSAEGGPFQTLAPVSLPEVTTADAADILQNSARLGGNVTNDGGDPGVTRGIYWQEDNPGSENGLQVTMGTGTGLFDQVVSNLPAGTLIYFRAYANNSAGERLGNELFFTTQSGPPTVESPTAVVLSATTATLGGTMTSDGGEAPVASGCGVEWGTTSGGPYVNQIPKTDAACTENNPFTVSADTLPTGTVVFFRAYATNSQGTGYSAQDSFTPAGAPIVTATPVQPASITLRSATLDGDVTNEGGSPVIERGFYWDTVQPPEAAGTKVVVNTSPGTGAFSRTIDGLSPGTTIYWKAYASNSVTTGYSGQEQFDTLAEPTVQVSGLEFRVLAGQSINMRWVRGDGDGVIVVMRGDAVTRIDPQDGNDYVGESDYSNLPLEELPPGSSGNFVVYKGPGTSLTVNGLTNLTTYQVAIYEYATTQAGPNYRLTPIVEAPATTTDFAVHNYDFGINCNKCHEHGSFNSRGTELEDICKTCHNPLDAASAKLEFANHVAPNRNPGMDNVDCGMCHELHNISRDANGDPIVTGNTTLSFNSITSQTEHNKSFLRANVDKYFPSAERAARPEAFLHLDTPKRVDGETVTQEADTPERAVEGGDATSARGYCQVCHTMTNYHRYNPASASAPAANDKGLMQCHDGSQDNLACATEVHCGDCHEHNNSFQGVNDNLPCEDCHDSGQGARPIITTQFDTAVVQSSHIPGGTPTKPDCVVCHGDHSHNGFVYGFNVDDGSTTYGTDAADTLSTGAGELYAPHCLSCHDSNGAASLPADVGDPTAGQTQNSPFINSNQPPPIDIVDWNNSGHDRPTAGNPTGPFGANPVTCVGDGANGCHGSGHGSQQNSLLAPATAATRSAAAFCYECHDGDGPSGINIHAEFNGVTNFRAQSLSGAMANQRHDVDNVIDSPTYTTGDQTYSSGAVTCKDCHSPHVDNATNPVHDPDDGTELIPYNPGGSYDKGGYNYTYAQAGDLDPINPEGATGGPYTEPDYIRFCLTCHDGNFPDPSIAMGPMYNIADTWQTDAHGRGQGGTGSSFEKGSLKPPYVTAQDDQVNDPTANYAAMNCNTCHGAHGSPNIFNLRESITVAGVQMQVGGLGNMPVPARIAADPTVYTLPPMDGRNVNEETGVQQDHYWGIWCTFCHYVQSHAGKEEDDSCTNGHRHGGGGTF
jgi:hypothetical protein